MEEPLVSVIIPCYRQAHLLGRTLESVVGQTWGNLEIIVVDDGSPDDVAGAVAPFGDRVKLISQENKGLSTARNTGFTASTGDFIKFLDSDDWLLPDCIAEQVGSIRELPGFISLTGYRLSHEERPDLDMDVWPGMGRLRHTLCFCNLGPPHIYLFPRKAISDAGGFDATERTRGGHEDYDLVCRLAALGYEAVLLHSIGCVYRKAPGSMSQHKENMRRTRVSVWREYARLLLQRSDLTASDLVHVIGGYLRLAIDDSPPRESEELFSTAMALLLERADEIEGPLLAVVWEYFSVLQWTTIADPFEFAFQKFKLRELIKVCVGRLVSPSLYRMPLSDPHMNLRLRKFRTGGKERPSYFSFANVSEALWNLGHRRAAVLGLSEEADLLCKILKARGIEMSCYVSSEGSGGAFSGRPVCSLEEALDQGVKAFVALSVPPVEEEVLALERRIAEDPEIALLSLNKVCEALRIAADTARRTVQKVCVYGGGLGGRLALAMLTARGVEVSSFVDSNPALSGHTLSGRRIFSLDEAIDEGERAFFIGSAKYAREMGQAILRAHADRGLSPLIFYPDSEVPGVARWTQLEEELTAHA